MAKNATDLFKVGDFTGFLQLLNKLKQACQFHQDQACCNLSFADLLQLVETTCKRPVEIINLQQVC